MGQNIQNDNFTVVKVSELDEATVIDENGYIPFVQNGVTKKVKLRLIQKFFKQFFGSAADSDFDEFESKGSADNVNQKSQTRDDALSELINNLEYTMYLIRNNKAHRAFKTKFLMQSQKSEIAANTVVTVTDDPANDPTLDDVNGDYLWDGNNFFKLPNNLMQQAERFAIEQLNLSGNKEILNHIDSVVDTGIQDFKNLITELGNSEAGKNGWTPTLIVDPITGLNQQQINDNYKTFNVKDYGAKLDGVTNDTDSFINACIDINKNGGGKLVVPFGLCLWGKQIFANGATNLGYSYKGLHLIEIKNCNTVVIEIQGTHFIQASDQKYGSFDPETGDAFFPTLPFTLSKYRAQLGNLFHLSNNKKISIIGSATYDGGMEVIQLGGLWGDQGRQLLANGLHLQDNTEVYAENLDFKNVCLDGFYLASTQALSGNVKSGKTTLVSCNSEFAGRQGLSWVGGNDLTTISCSFGRTGKGKISSAPAAGIDMEPNNKSGNRRALFLNTYIYDNAGAGVICYGTNTSNVTFMGGNIVGTTWDALNITATGIKFNNVHITGSILGGDGVTYESCTIDDDIADYTDIPYTRYTNIFASTSSPVIKSCTINLKNLKFGVFKNAILERNTINIIDEKNALIDKASIVSTDDTTVMTSNKFYDLRTNPQNTLSIVGGFATDPFNEILTKTKKLFWSGSTGSDGIKPIGIKSSGNSPYGLIGTSFIGIAKNTNVGIDNASKILRIIASNAKPTLPDIYSPYTAGDVIKNTNPTLNTFNEIICVTSGYPCDNAWQATFTYSLNSYVYVSNRVYQCTVAGTSSNAAPSHMSGVVNDGTVAWTYIGIKAGFRIEGVKISGLTNTSTTADIVKALKDAGLAI